EKEKLMTAVGTTSGGPRSRSGRDGYDRISVAPVAGALGAEISGVDLAGDLDEVTVAEIRQAFLDHHVVFFRGQDLTAEALIAFGRRFGELDTHPFVEGTEAHPEVIEIVTDPSDSFNFGGGWHADVTFLEEPDMGSILYAVDVPSYGGDTLFANQHRAYDALSDTMKRVLDGLVALHSPGPQYKAGGYSTLSKSMRTKNPDKADGVVGHPLVRTHPETGAKGLYVNRGFTTGIEGMTRDESAALLGYLFRHATSEPFTCRFRWEPGSVAMWDNRSVQHYALYDYRGQARRMRRITIHGDRPF
ncbi:MAG TPA: TauD/TfdA family dioxygenase, partial [Acidimicrobiales bacterium]|nr:TauD/TfdA family dioxygenase [Acidimicrobiales bacterium]